MLSPKLKPKTFVTPVLYAWALTVLVLCITATVHAQPESRWSSTNTQGLWSVGGWSGSALQNSSTILFTNNDVLTTTNDANASWRYTGLYMRSNATADRTIVGNVGLFGEWGGSGSKVEVNSGPNHRNLTISGNVSVGGNTNLRYEFNPVGGSIIIGGSISDFGSGRVIHMFGNNVENDLVRSVVVSNGITGGNGLLVLRQYANLVLMGSSTYTNNTEIDTGTLMLGQGDITGSLSSSSTIYIGNATVAGNATFRLGTTNGGITLSGEKLQLNDNPLGGRRTIQSDNTSGTNTINRNVDLRTQFFITNSAGGTLRFAGGFTNTLGSVVQQGAGTNAIVQFAAANAFTNFFLDGGQAVFQAENSWGTGVIAMGRNTDSSVDAAVTFAHGYTVTNNFSIRTNEAEKTIRLQGGTGTLQLAGNITNNATGTGRGLAFDAPVDRTIEVSGQILGTGAVTQAGLGRLLLTAENSYTGGTLIEAGVLEISGTSALGTGSVHVGAGGILAGSGSIAGNTTVLGTIAPGASPGLLDFEGDLTFEAASALTMEISSTGTRGVNYDAINVGGVLSIDSAATLTLAYIDGYAPQFGDSFQLLSFSSVSGEFVFDTNIGGGLSWDVTDLYTTGEVMVVPEPSTWALLGMGGLVALWFGRRRCRS